MQTVAIPVADEVLFTLKIDIQRMRNDFMQSLAMQYFREKRLGLGLAAHMAGMGKHEFVHLLGRHGVDIYQYSEDELQDEFALVDKIQEGVHEHSR